MALQKLRHYLEIFLWFMLVLAANTIVLYSPLLLPPYAGDSLAVTLSSGDPNGWISLLHIGSNGYISWRLTPALLPLTAVFGLKTYYLFQLLLGTLGLYVISQRSSRMSGFILTAVSGPVTLVLFGLDTVVLACFMMFPWAVAALNRFSNASTFRWEMLLVGGLLVLFSPNQLLLPMLLAAVVVTVGSSPTTISRAYVFYVLALIICGLVLAMQTPLPFSANYPAGGHLVPSWGVVDGLTALVGERPGIITVDRELVRSRLFLPAFVITGIGLLACLSSFLSGEFRRKRAFIYLLLFLVVSLVTDVVSSVHFAQVAPLQSLSRLLPGLFSYPLALMAMGLVLSISLLLLNSWIAVIATCFTVGVTFWFGGADPRLWPVLYDQNRSRIWAELAAGNFGQLGESISLSPSYAVVARVGAQVLGERGAREGLKFTSITESNGRFRSFTNEHQLPTLSDGKDSTRWSTASGYQRGGEWIAAVFQENVRLKAVRVRTGRYFTDFPRGLSLEVAVDCSADKLDSTLFTEVYREPATQGEIKFTDSGFPYFGEQYSSVVFLPKAMDVRCFRVLQIGSNSHFDWSVAELEIAVE